MPNCFQLTRKGEKEPEKLQSIDNRLWSEIGKITPDPDKWFRNWYNTVGFLLAAGMSLEKQFDTAEFSDDLNEVILFLAEHYTSDAWYSPHKR